MVVNIIWDLNSSKIGTQDVFTMATETSRDIMSEEHYEQPHAEPDSGIQSPSTPNQRHKTPRQATYPEQSSSLSSNAPGFHSRQSSLPASVTTETNGIYSPRPLTTSQHRPPKICQLDRRPAVLSPTPTDSSSQPSSAEDLQPTSSVYLPDDALSRCRATRKQLDERSTSEESSTGASSGKSSEQPPLQKDSSFEYYKDSSGIDLHEFIVKTLRENPRDRLMLLKLEKDFNGLIRDQGKIFVKYPAMTSYHRMLVHRVAAYFGLEHNVDSTGKCVIVNKTENTRIPERSFQAYCSQEYADEELSLPKAIMRRDNTTSSEEGTLSPRPGSPVVPRRTMEGKKSKSFEERTEEYIKARERIFNKDQSTTSSQSSGDGQDQILLTPVKPNLPLATPVAVTTSQTVESPTVRPVHWPPRIQALEQQKNEERNAALRIAAHVTGGKVPLDNKRFSEKTQKYSMQQAMTGYAMPWGSDGTLGMEPPLVSYPAGVSQQVAVTPGTAGHSQPGLLVGLPSEGMTQGAVVVNPATGAPVLGPDGLPVIYQPGYISRGNMRQMSPGAILCASTGSSAQPGSYQFVMPMPQMGNPLHYVVVQPAGQTRGAVPQSPQEVATAQSSGNLQGPMQPMGYQDLPTQLTAMTVAPRPEGAEEDTVAPEPSYTPTSPTADVPLPLIISSPQGQYFVLPQQGRPIMPSQMYQGQTMHPQYLPAQGYTAYTQGQYAQYTTGEPTGRYPQSRTPPAPQRSTSPVVMTPPYVSNTPPSSQSYTRPSPAQTPPFQRTPPPSQMQPYFRGMFQPSVPAVQGTASMYTQIGGNQGHYTSGQVPHPQVVSGGQQPWRGHPGGKKGGKVGEQGLHTDIAQYRSLPAHETQRVQNSIATFGPHPRQLLTMVPLSPYSHVPANRFFPSPNPYSPYMPPQHVHRKSRPRPPSGGHKTGSSRSTPHSTSSSSSDQDHKTVNHILEVYDLPEGLSPNETDNMLADLSTAGARILQINNSSGQSGQGPSCPTVLAIFKSADDAQRALETVKNPRYKLRVSQKSPTHFSGDGSLNRPPKVGTSASSSSSSPST